MRPFALLLAAPLAIFATAFLALPLVRLLGASAGSEAGWAIYAEVLTNARYLAALRDTVLVSLATTAAALAVATTAGLFLERHRFAGRGLLVATLTFPLAFPGVVVGFLIILLGGRQGLVNWAAQLVAGERVVFAYSMTGLFLGYLYFSIPRVMLTVMAAAAKLDPRTEEAARACGAGPWRVLRDVTLPGLAPALAAAGAIAFATAMGAFGTAFTLATDIDVLPMTIYTAFTLSADIATACALSVVLGLVTWAVLIAARGLSGTAVAAGG
jgi:putative spermidine/putrescine transport system permease protein